MEVMTENIYGLELRNAYLDYFMGVARVGAS
jgi:hypothetical protein